MVEKTISDGHSVRREALPRMCRPEIEPLMQSLLATLANIDCEHELEAAKLGRSTVSVSVKSRVLAGLNQRYEERREPYVRHLETLHQRIRSQAA